MKRIKRINTRQVDLLAAIVRRRNERTLPDDPVHCAAVALALCEPEVLAHAGIEDAASAWTMLPPGLRNIVCTWSDTEPQPTRVERGSELIQWIMDPLRLRRSRRESQTVFWRRVGVTQSAGARYESDRRLSPSVVRLLGFFVDGTLATDALLDLRERALQSHQVRSTREGATGSPASPKSPRTLRESVGENQTVFWSRIGVSQSGGSRYESGRSMPLSAAMIIEARCSGELTTAQLDTMSKLLREAGVADED